MTTSIQPVILCGGAGTRLWPASRGTHAKQFLALTGQRSLFEMTIERTAGTFPPPLILCGAPHVDLVREQAGGTGARLIVEPEARNTAAAVALAVASVDADILLLVMPSDHVIADIEAFHAAIEKAARLARGDWIVTFGISPGHPDTGFGYIASGAALGDAGFQVARFVEKPPLAEAEHMLAAGGFDWNAGIFLFRAGRMRAAMRRHCPAVLDAAEQAIAAGEQCGDRFDAAPAAFAQAPSISIDYAVMEKDERIAVVPVSMGWSDLGSWQAVHALTPCDAAANGFDGRTFLHDSQGCLVRSGGKRVSLIGMENVAVIVDGDDILVMPLARSQDVRAAAEAHE